MSKEYLPLSYFRTGFHQLSIRTEQCPLKVENILIRCSSHIGNICEETIINRE